MMNTLERLEKWNSGHKARWTEIGRENGYGAACWMVELHYGKDSVVCCAFMNLPDEVNSNAFGTYESFDDEHDKEVTLEETINEAINRAESKWGVETK